MKWGEETGQTITYWIGVEDNLARRILSVWTILPYEGSSAMTEYVITEFHSFNQDFNIQPPPEDQIADEDG